MATRSRDELDEPPGRDKWTTPGNPPRRETDVRRPHSRLVRSASRRWKAKPAAKRGPRENKGPRADWPLENPEVGYAGHKLVLSTDHAIPTAGHRSDDAARPRRARGRPVRSPPPCTRTTARASTSSRSNPASPGAARRQAPSARDAGSTWPVVRAAATASVGVSARGGDRCLPRLTDYDLARAPAR